MHKTLCSLYYITSHDITLPRFTLQYTVMRHSLYCFLYMILHHTVAHHVVPHASVIYYQAAICQARNGAVDGRFNGHAASRLELCGDLLRGSNCPIPHPDSSNVLFAILRPRCGRLLRSPAKYSLTKLASHDTGGMNNRQFRFLAVTNLSLSVSSTARPRDLIRSRLSSLPAAHYLPFADVQQA